METGVWCSPGLVYSSPPFALRHLTYATSCRTSGLQTVARGLTNKGRFQCKLHHDVASLSANLWHPPSLFQSKRTGAHLLALDVLFLTAFLTNKMPQKPPEIRGSRADKPRVVCLPVLWHHEACPCTNSVPRHEANQRHRTMPFTAAWHKACIFPATWC